MYSWWDRKSMTTTVRGMSSNLQTNKKTSNDAVNLHGSQVSRNAPGTGTSNGITNAVSRTTGTRPPQRAAESLHKERISMRQLFEAFDLHTQVLTASRQRPLILAC